MDASAGNQPTQQQQQQQAPAPAQFSFAPGLLAPSGLEGYDMSSLDQLQAHALQLSASAGMTNLLMPNNNNNQNNNGQQQQQQGQQQQQQGQQQQPFIFLQPSNGGQGLPTLASLQQQQPGQQTNNGSQQQQQQPQQQFILTGPNGQQIAAPANFSQQIFAAVAGGNGGTLTLNPNGTIQQHQQSYSSAGIPIPMPMLIPQQQQQQQPQLQPLQPAPPSSNSGDNSSNNPALAGSKRLHDSSVVSTSTTSLDSGALNNNNANGSNGNLMGGAPVVDRSSTNMNMADFPEFQLRNKDGSIITEKDLEKMSPAERRRYERNLREQQRSFRISQQIQQLRDVLAESKVPFKPNKYSILVSVADYIKQLQTRAIMLDSEHKKLFKTIQETNEMVASGQIPDATNSASGGAAPSGGGNNASSSSSSSQQQQGQATNENGELLFVQGLDYQAVFEQTPTANGVASIDGRILACNRELESILECPRDHIERQSLFTLVQNHQEIFEAMAELLKRADALSNGSIKADPVQLLYWSGEVVTPNEKKLGMNITLACTKDGSPKFFSFCMSLA